MTTRVPSHAEPSRSAGRIDATGLVAASQITAIATGTARMRDDIACTYPLRRQSSRGAHPRAELPVPPHGLEQDVEQRRRDRDLRENAVFLRRGLLVVSLVDGPRERHDARHRRRHHQRLHEHDSEARHILSLGSDKMDEPITQRDLDVLSACVTESLSRRILGAIPTSETAAFGSSIVRDPVSALVDVRETSEWQIGFGQLLRDAASFPRHRKYLFLFRRDGDEIDETFARSVRGSCAGFGVETCDVMEDLWNPYGSAAYTTPPFVSDLRGVLRRALHEETDTYDVTSSRRTTARPPDPPSTTASRTDATKRGRTSSS
eukprot:jgi/Mesvir1/14639/Mv05309-RA.1